MLLLLLLLILYTFVEGGYYVVMRVDLSIPLLVKFETKASCN